MAMVDRLEIDEYPFENPDLEAAYTEHPYPAGMAIRKGLRHSSKRARELEAHGLYKKPPLSGRKFCYACGSFEEVDLVSVNAVRRTVDEMEPAWIEAVKDAARIFNTPDLIKGWLEDDWGLDLQVVVAILMNLEAQGELPEG
jgi:hypothetical protein